MTKHRIHISYSDGHFHPEKKYPEKEWYSCSQIAKHIWECLSKRFDGVTYGDAVPDEEIDVLWTNRLNPWHPSVKQMVYFASVEHYEFVTRAVKKATSSIGVTAMEGVYSFAERWNYWQTLARSSHVLAIGNDTVRKSFDCQLLTVPLDVIDCGIDMDRFSSGAVVLKEDIFVHNATRFQARKGSHIVADAWKVVSKELPSAKLLLLGRPGDVDMSAMLQGTERVIFVGKYEAGSKEYIDKLRAAKWVVLQSCAEGQAGTVLEAMACGCVPITTSDTGIDANLYGGYVTEPVSSGLLSEQMIKAAKEWTPQVADSVIEKVKEKHSWHTFESKVIDITERLLNQSRPRHKAPSLILPAFLLQLVKSGK